MKKFFTSSLFIIIRLLFFISFCFPLATSAQYQPATVQRAAKQPNSQLLPYQEVQFLRNTGKIQQAKQKAQQQLGKYPNDADTLVVLGSIYYGEKNFSAAKKYFAKGLTIAPRYLDAYIPLVEIELAAKQYQAALHIVKQGLKYFPTNQKLKEYKKLAMQRKSISVSPGALAIKKPIQQTYKERLADFMVCKAAAYYSNYQYYQAARLSKTSIAFDPNNGKAKELLNKLNEINPKYALGVNEVGLYTQNDYVSDLNQIWDYSTLYYSRNTIYGTVIASLNYSARVGNNASEGELEFFPVFSKNFTLDLDVTYANQPNLFPAYSLSAEGYFYFPQFVDFSFGARYADLTVPNLKIYTGSIAKETENYWFCFRPYHFVPSGMNSTSTLYTATIRRYLQTQDFNIGVTLGWGRNPDLNNLQLADFIVLENQFVSINVQIPVFNHKLAILLGADCQHQVYPTGLIRNLTGGTIGLLWRF